MILKVVVSAVAVHMRTCMTLGSRGCGALKNIKKKHLKKAEVNPSTATYSNITIPSPQSSLSSSSATSLLARKWLYKCVKPQNTEGLRSGLIEAGQSRFAMTVNPTFLPSWSFMRAPQVPGFSSSSSIVTSEVGELLHTMDLASYAMLQTWGDSCQVLDRH